MPRPGRGTFVAERPADARRRRRPARPLLAGGRARHAARRRRQPQRAARAAAARRDPAVDRLPRPRAAAARRHRRGARPRGAPSGRLGPRPGRGPRGAARLVRARGRRRLRRPHDMVVCPGGQSALATACRALAAPGEPILVEAPTYVGALAAARMAQLRVVPVPTDADGVRPGAAGRGVRALRRAAAVPAADVSPTRTGRTLVAGPPRGGARRRRGRGRVRGRGRLGPRPGDRRRAPPALAAARPPRPRRLHPLAVQARGARVCASPRSARAARRGERLRLARVDRRLLRVGPAAGGGGRAGRQRPPGAGTCARCAAPCASAATRSPARSSASSRRCG